MNYGRNSGADYGSGILRTERLTPAALEAAAEFLPNTVLPSGESFDVVGTCVGLLSSLSLIGVSISRVDSRKTHTVIAVGAAVFVSDQATREIREDPVPGVTERALHAASRGEALPLNSHEITARNAAHGLNVVVVLHHHRPDLTLREQHQVRGELTAAFLNDLRGYRLREVVADTWDDELDWATDGGFRIRNTYEAWYRTHEVPARRRVLIGLEQTEAEALPGTVLGLLFHYQSPRLGLTASQRRLLAEAVQHQTDAEIAGKLQVSISAVKKTWVAAFEHAGDVLGELDTPGPRRDATGTRGAQKRHKLLAYLREHPEELKP